MTLKTPSAEDTLLDYAVRLTHHRAGRKALFLPLTALAPESRTGGHWRLLDSVLAPIILRHGGEFFRLRCGDAVAVFASLDQTMLERLTAKLTSLFRDDPLIERAAKPAADAAPSALPQGPLCHWWDLGVDYDGFLALARKIKEAGDDAAGPRSAVETKEAEPDEDARSAPTRGSVFAIGADPRSLPLVSWLQAPPRGASGLGGLARLSPIVRWQAGATPTKLGEFVERHAQALTGLGLPAGDLERNPQLAPSLETLIDRRILVELPLTRPASSVLTVSVRLEALLGPEFLGFHRDWAVGAWVPVTWLVPRADLEADSAAYRYARDFLKRIGHRLGLAEVALDDAMTLDLVRLKPESIALRWNPEQAPAPGSREARRLEAWLASGGAALALLTRCDTREATNDGRALGFTRFEGRQAEALLRGVAAAR